MIKFFGEPLKEIKSKLTNKVVFRFDSNGEFVTEDAEIIKRAMGFFDHIEMKAEVVGEKVAKTVQPEKIVITTTATEESKEFKCKKCNYGTNNSGELLRHYKTHKEGDK